MNGSSQDKRSTQDSSPFLKAINRGLVGSLCYEVSTLEKLGRREELITQDFKIRSRCFMAKPSEGYSYFLWFILAAVSKDRLVFIKKL